MKGIGIIPARYASTRLPGKPLIKLGEKSMIQRVYEQASMVKSLSEVIVATDDQRIIDEVNGFGGKVIATSDQHLSGTDRCAEVLETVGQHYDFVINIQGDEPFIQPEQIELLVEVIKKDGVEIGTLVKKIEAEEELININTPKVVVSSNMKALYFSRQPIPFIKQEPISNWLSVGQFYKHIGMYAYRSSILSQLANLQPSKLEIAESLEQLRWLENGFSVHVGITTIETISIDTADDVIKAQSFIV